MLDVFNKDYLKDVKFFGEKTEIQKNTKRLCKNDDQQNAGRLQSLEADLIHLKKYKNKQITL